MQINEKLRNFPIKFYQDTDGTIYYESAFVTGKAKTLNDAFKELQKHDWEHDLIYYFADVVDVEFGAYEPAIRDIKRKGKLYLGKINLKLNLDTGWGEGKDTITHLSKHPEDLPAQTKFLNKMRNQEKRDKFIKDIKSGLKKVAGYFTGKTYEMFYPEKTRYDLICKHCGSIIPIGTYYECYENNNYHLECIWDKFCNEHNFNEYQNCRNYFFSLQDNIGHWPSIGLDIEDDYIMDLDLVKSNDRKTGLNEEAAMYKSNQPTFDDFYDYVINNPKCKKCYFQMTTPFNVRIPSDTILHDYKKHEMTSNDWKNLLTHLDNIKNASISRKTLASNKAPVAILHVSISNTHYGVSIQLDKNFNQIMTAFIDAENKIENWVETSPAGGLSDKPIASLGASPESVVQPSQDSNNIIQHVKQKIKSI